MPCPTCDYSLAVLIIADMERCFQCERCGTTVIQRRPQFDKPFAAEPTAVYAPKLVERCRTAGNILLSFGLITEPEWERLGLPEAIYRPEDRPSKETP